MKQQSGVDIDKGNYCSQIAFSWAKKTFNNREGGIGSPCLGVDGAFANIMDFNGQKIGISSDGIGTKIEIAERIGIYDTLGFDLVAMVADDLVANGIEPVNLSNILDVNFLDSGIVNLLMKGLYDACNFAGLIVTGGEIAELGSRIQGYGDKMHFNWCATGIGILPPDRDIIDGGDIKPKDVIISLKSRGFRSNGFSLLRKILEDNFGSEWHQEFYDSDSTWGQILLTPSLIYTPLIVKLLKNNFKLKGISHITGGGIHDNLSRVLKGKNLRAILDNLFPPLDFMNKAQSLGNVDQETAYRLWNMGNGMLLIVDSSQSDGMVRFIENCGYQGKLAGEIVAEAGVGINMKKLIKV